MKQRYEPIYYTTISVRRQNFLAENGIYPIKECGDTAVYLKTKKLSSLLEDFFIIRYIFGGKY